jgi:hypothetical protein
MSTWLNLLVKEAALLALLGALGFGVAAHLRGGSAIGSRIALAPAFGLALGSAVLTTASYFMPMKVGAWVVLVPLALASIAVGVRVLRKREGRLLHHSQLSVGAQLVAVALVVTGALNYPLAERESLGPVGYSVADAVGYEGSIEWLKSHTLRDHDPQPWDLSDVYGVGYSKGFQQVGFDSTAAGTNVVFGWSASQTQSAFMVALIVVGALGLFGAVRGFTRSRTWAAPVAGLLFAGPLAYELFVAGSEAALAGLALIPAAALVGSRLLEEQRPATIVAFGVLTGGIQTVYPLAVAAMALWIAVVLAVKAVAALRARRLSRRVVLRALELLVLLAILSVVIAPVAFGRNVTYWRTVATTDYLKTLATTSLPVYDLPADVIPGYVFQTREFFFLRVDDAGMQQYVLSIVVPAFLIGLAAYGVWRYQSAWILAAGALAAAFLAYYTSEANQCSYCVQRNLLMLGPLVAALVGVGIAAVASRTWLPFQIAALVIAVGVVGLVGHKSSVMARRAEQGAYALPVDARKILPELKDRRGPLYLEAIGAALDAVYEMPAIYHAVNESTSQRLAVNAERDDQRGMLYLGGPRPRGPEFTPDYRWVLTRAAGIQTNRETVARSGAFALQERRSGPDASVISGFAVDQADRDREGEAWVQGPLHFWVSAPTPAPVWLRLELRGKVAAKVRAPKTARVLAQEPGLLSLCLPVRGSGDVREAVLQLKRLRVPLPGPAGGEFGAPPVPGKVLRLAAMSATLSRCAP